MMAFSVDYKVDGPFDHNNDQVISRPPWLGVSDVVTATYFACKNIFVDISDFLYCVFAEQYCRFQDFNSFFSHKSQIFPTNINKLAY